MGSNISSAPQSITCNPRRSFYRCWPVAYPTCNLEPASILWQGLTQLKFRMDLVSSDTFVPAGAAKHTLALLHRLAVLELLGARSVWQRAAAVRQDLLGYFVPETNLFTDVNKRERRAGKELEYLYSAGCWLEHGLAELELALKATSGVEQGRGLHLAREYLRQSKEISHTRTQCWQLVISKGVKAANKLASIVEVKALSKQDRIPSTSYRVFLAQNSENTQIRKYPQHLATNKRDESGSAKDKHDRMLSDSQVSSH